MAVERAQHLHTAPTTNTRRVIVCTLRIFILPYLFHLNLSASVRVEVSPSQLWVTMPQAYVSSQVQYGTLHHAPLECNDR